jgi:hypothetical protein
VATNNTNLNVNVNANPIKQAAKQTQQAANQAQSAVNKFFRGNPNTRHQGRSSRSGGKQGFTGTFADFAQRDEFTGRAGTAARAVNAMRKSGGPTWGALAGLSLALISVEELANAWIKVQDGEGVKKSIGELIDRILPDVLTKKLPEIVDPSIRRERSKMMAILKQELAEISEQQRLREDVLFRDKVRAQLIELLAEEEALNGAQGHAGSAGGV